MMIRTQDLSFKHAAQIAEGDPAAVAALGEACLISGMTMTILGGQTSPSSGVEHIISHFWDLLGDIHGKDHFWHGTQVGVGVLMGLALYEMIEELDPRTIDPAKLLANRRSWNEIETYLKTTYPGQWEYFLKTARDKTIPDADYPAYVQDILDNWYPMWTALKPYRIPFKLVQHGMKAAGAATSLAEVHQTRETALQALLDGNFYRPRYTILDLAWELGIFPDRAEDVLKRAEVL
jgi:glycerol-1-phosphate dehydrogenase [NAD(P)+]